MSKISVIGIGPGSLAELTPRAAQAIEGAEVVAGYNTYIKLIEKVLVGKKIIGRAMMQEVERCRLAIDETLAGKNVAVVSSGDAGVYGMAGLAAELAEDFPGAQIKIIAGVTAALSGAALLGSPLTNDFAVISLSDLLTPWEVIEKRLEGAALGDFAVVIYNPMSKKRTDTLKKACDIILKHRSPDTPCGIASNTGREGETCGILTLSELRGTAVDMFTTVFIGNSATRVIGGRLVTPRGYKL